MGQPAYDRNAVRRRRAPQPQRKANLRVAKGGKRRLNPLQAAVHNAMNLVAAALLVGFAISLLWSEAQLVELNDQIQDAKAQLVSEQSQYTYYNSTLNSKTNIASVEETAGQPSGSDEDRPQPDHLHPPGRKRRTGAPGVHRAAMDRLFVHRRGEHSGHREINGESVRRRTLFSVYGHRSLNK